MPYFQPHYFENLKQQILNISGFTNLIPANCKTISLLIEEKTRQKISETTLKRVFGFALSKFQPSLFTLDAMSKYCGYRSWSDFCDNQEEVVSKTTATDPHKNTLSHNASKITQFTLQALKNKSGIPYYQTIKRKFMDDHFDIFLNGPYNATIFAAPTGYGKTIALTHWIEEMLASKVTEKNEDIVLFFSMNALMNVFFSGRSLNEWILALLGYAPEQDMAQLLESKQRNQGRFFLIIDGLDDYTFKNDQFQLLLNQVLDIFSLYKSHSWFKLVLTMRTATLINYSHLLDYDHPEWFKGFVTHEDETTNVPLFNISEVKRLCVKINPNTTHVVDADVVKKINYPLYFQFYYKSHKDDFSLKKIDQFFLYELIATFILNKIYLGPNSVEKILLINALWEKMDMKNQTYSIKKLAVESSIKQYKQAYQELMSIGYIREFNTSTSLNYESFIYFGTTDFLTYTVAKKLLDENDLIFNLKLIESINLWFPDNPIKLPVLKWCIIYALKSGQSVNFELLYKARLNPNEKSDIIIFLGDMFKKEFNNSRNSESVFHHFHSDHNAGLSNYFWGLEFINPDYKKTLNNLLNYGLSNYEKILMHCSLAIISIIELDVNQLEEHLAHLKRFSAEDYQEFAINPLLCLDTIYYYLKYGIVKQESFIDLTKFYFNHSNTNINTAGKYPQDVLFLLGVYTLTICKKPNKILKLINAINHTYQGSNDFQYGYHFLLKIVTTEATLALNKTDEGMALYDKISQDYNNNKKDYTPYMRAAFYLLRLRVTFISDPEQDIFDQIQLLLHLAEQYGYKLIKLNCLIFVLENQASLKINTDFYKLIYYDFIKLIRESGFRGESFVDTNNIMVDLS